MFGEPTLGEYYCRQGCQESEDAARENAEEHESEGGGPALAFPQAGEEIFKFGVESGRVIH